MEAHVAPRAGFEVARKLLNGRGLRVRHVADTPGDTPSRSALEFLSLTRSDACGGARLQTEAADHLARPRMPAFRIG
jgi:hypothetical protein